MLKIMLNTNGFLFDSSKYRKIDTTGMIVVSDKSRKFDLQGIEMEMVLKVLSSVKADEGEGNECFFLTLSNSEVSFHLAIQKNEFDTLRLYEVYDYVKFKCTHSSILEVLNSMFFDGSYGSNINYEFEFGITGEKIKSSLLSSEKIEQVTPKRRKIGYISFLKSDLLLILKVKIKNEPSIFFEPTLLRFVFFTAQRVRIDPLPNEIVIEIFRFLSPTFLLRDICIVNKRFYQLVDGEYMFRCHHIKYLNLDYELELDSLKKDSTQSWKQFTKQLCASSRISWILPTSSEEPIGRILKLPRSRINSLRMGSVRTNIFVSPDDSHLWELEIRRNFDDRDGGRLSRYIFLGFVPENYETYLDTGRRSDSYAINVLGGLGETVGKVGISGSLSPERNFIVVIRLSEGKMHFKRTGGNEVKIGRDIACFHRHKKYCLAVDTWAPAKGNIEFELRYFRKL